MIALLLACAPSPAEIIGTWLVIEHTQGGDYSCGEAVTEHSFTGGEVDVDPAWESDLDEDDAWYDVLQITQQGDELVASMSFEVGLAFPSGEGWQVLSRDYHLSTEESTNDDYQFLDEWEGAQENTWDFTVDDGALSGTFERLYFSRDRWEESDRWSDADQHTQISAWSYVEVDGSGAQNDRESDDCDGDCVLEVESACTSTGTYTGERATAEALASWVPG